MQCRNMRRFQKPNADKIITVIDNNKVQQANDIVHKLYSLSLIHI